VGKALDDRIGCFMMCKLAEKLKNTKRNLFFVFTVQEEIGLYGAQTSVWEINPDWGLAIDVMGATDYYEEGPIGLGRGPTITIMDVEMIANQCVNNWIKDIAKNKGIPLQKVVEEFGTTDATKIMMSRGGVPSTTLGVPVRNLHSTVSIAHTGDIKQAIEIIYHLLKKPPQQCVVTHQ